MPAGTKHHYFVISVLVCDFMLVPRKEKKKSTKASTRATVILTDRKKKMFCKKKSKITERITALRFLCHG